MHRTALLLGSAFLCLTAASAGAQSARTTLDIYVVDVEGGNATLFVNPAGESLLIDTGNANGAVRDAGRIFAAAKDAGLTQIDRLIITHWHGDHYGGMAELEKLIPIREYMDHGPNQQPAEAADKFLAEVYPTLYAKGKHTVLKAADKIAALAKCIEEEKSGNLEFRRARAEHEENLAASPLPEVRYFMEKFLPGYRLSLDELKLG